MDMPLRSWKLAGLVLVACSNPVRACCPAPPPLLNVAGSLFGILFVYATLVAGAGLLGSVLRRKTSPDRYVAWRARAVVMTASLALFFGYGALLFQVPGLSYPGEEDFSASVPGVLFCLAPWAFAPWLLWRRYASRPEAIARLGRPLWSVPIVLPAVSLGLGILLELGPLAGRSVQSVACLALGVSTFAALALTPIAVLWNEVRLYRTVPAVGTTTTVGGPMRLNARAAVCRVCGSSIEGPPVLCNRCLAPHHSDCWSYAARCSTYGCGGRATRKLEA